jgi:hypothetical protein
MSDEHLGLGLDKNPDKPIDEKKQRERDLILKNLAEYPYFRGVYAEVDLGSKGKLT